MKKAEEGQVEIVQPEKGAVDIIPFGTDEKIRLTISIVRNMIAVPTKTGKYPDDNQCIKFMMLCRAKHLNPFEGDAYMLGYETNAGPQWSQITAHQVFLKRAEASKQYDGMESGVIVMGKEGGILEREGDLVYKEETLIGGWAKVYRKNLGRPIYRRLKLETFNTGLSRWLKDPAGMIVKCAEADALRTSFPTHLGGLFIEEEPQVIDIPAKPVVATPEIPGVKKLELEAPKKSANGASKKKSATLKPKEEVPKDQPKNEIPSTEKKVEPPAPYQTALLEKLRAVGKTFDDFLAVAYRNDWLKEGRTYDDDDFKLFLADDEWSVVLSQLEKK